MIAYWRSTPQNAQTRCRFPLGQGMEEVRVRVKAVYEVGRVPFAQGSDRRHFHPLTAEKIFFHDVLLVSAHRHVRQLS